MPNEEKPNSEKPVPLFDPKYHLRQWDTCYDSTRAFLKFLGEHKALATDDTQSVIDLCCGSGANLYWLKQQYPGLKLTGIDIIPDLVEFGNRELSLRGVSDASIVEGDVYDLDVANIATPDGLIALQTISWLPDEVGFVDAVTSLNPQWVALSGLMMPGPRSFRCLINNDDDPSGNVNYYNTFSIPYVENMFDERGYGDFVFEPFQIKIDIPRPAEEGSATYTEMTEDGRRLQISGALLMNWYFMLARKTG